jgi:hypothetical protein
MWRYLFLLPVYLLAGSLPLLTDIGVNLEYEYALLASYFALICVPALAFFLPNQHLPRTETGAYGIFSVPFEVLWIFLISPLVGLAPGAFLFATGQCPCSPTGFSFWMAVVWYPAWILAHAVFHAVLRGRVQGVAKRKMGLAIVLTYAALILVLCLTLWNQPQKRIVHLLAGFIHGPIYDEWIGFDAGLLMARAGHACLAAALLLAVWFRGQTAIACSVIVFAGGWLGLSGLAGNFPSTHNHKRDLDKLLSTKLEGEGFTLRYRRAEKPKVTTEAAPVDVEAKDELDADPDSDAEHKQAILRLFRDTEFHVKELKDLLGTDVPHVEVYVYPNEDRKKLWFGGGATDVADVKTPSIHITAEGWPHPTLRHELVHALTSDIAFHGLGFHPNIAFTEGLAMALAPGLQTLTLDEGAGALLDTDRLPNVEDLFSASFWKVSGSRAYTVAGSLLRYILAKHGIEAVKKLYGGASWKDALGTDEQAVLTAWQAHLRQTVDKERLAPFTEALFRHPGVLKDVCPHGKADYRRSRDDSVFVRMRQPIGWDPEQGYLAWLQQLDPNDQSVRLRIWKKEIRRVAGDRFATPGRIQTWRETLARAKTFPPKTLEDVEMGVLESDLARLAGDVEGSIKLLGDLKGVMEKQYFGESLRRDIEARLKIEQATSGGMAIEWRKFLAGWRKNLPDNSVFGPWITAYLVARNARDTALSEFDMGQMAMMTPDPSLPASFHSEWYRILAGRMMRQELYAAAATTYEMAAKSALPGSRDAFAENARWARFYAEKGPLGVKRKSTSN